MSNNLGRTPVTVNMTQKEVAIEDSDGRLDAAISDKHITTFSGATASITIGEEDFQTHYFFQVEGTTSAPSPKIKTANVQRGMFAVKNMLAQDLEVEDYGALLANIVVPSGATYVFVAHDEGNDVIVRGGEPVFTLNFEPAARAATTANIVLSAPQTIDGVSVIAGDRVLVKNQTSSVDNGIYTVAAGAWSRASATWGQGTAFAVNEGTANGNTIFVLTTPPPITIGVTAVNFAPLQSTVNQTFLSLTDIDFSAYTGLAGFRVQVNATEDGLEAVEDPVAATVRSWLNSARAASTANLTLVNEQTVDGVALIAGDRCLVKNQTAADENGVYEVVSGGAWTRTLDFDVDAEVLPGTTIGVEEGTVNATRLYMLSTPAPIIVDTTNLTFTHLNPDPVSLITTAVDNLAFKRPCRVATTANITIATALNSGDTIDGVTLANGDRVLVKNQSSASENGIYVVAASPARATDANANGELIAGGMVVVAEGSTNADKIFIITTNDPIVVGTDGITFTEFVSGGGGGAASIDWKDSCRAATTGNITIATQLNNGDTIDGVVLATGDRVLVKDQSSPADNGIYVVGVSPARSTDADTDAEVTSGLCVAITEGTVNADYVFMLTTNDPITVGATSLVFAKAATKRFVELLDAPSSFSGAARKLTRVNAGATALEFVDHKIDCGNSFGGVPGASVVAFVYVANDAIDFPAGLTGSMVNAKVAATAQADFDLQKNGASVGTVRFAAAGTVATYVGVSAFSLASGDRLEAISPASPDATLANIFWNLRGIRAS